MDKEKFRNNLIQLRKKMKMTQSDISEIFSVTPQAVSKWENGDSLPDIDVLIKLAAFYNLTIDELINGEVEEKEEIKNTKKEEPKVINKESKNYKFQLFNICFGFSNLLLLIILLFLPLISKRISASTLLINSGYEALGSSSNIMIIFSILFLFISIMLDIMIGFLPKKVNQLYYAKNILLSLSIIFDFLKFITYMKPNNTFGLEAGFYILVILKISDFITSLIVERKYLFNEKYNIFQLDVLAFGGISLLNYLFLIGSELTLEDSFSKNYIIIFLIITVIMFSIIFALEMINFFLHKYDFIMKLSIIGVVLLAVIMKISFSTKSVTWDSINTTLIYPIISLVYYFVSFIKKYVKNVKYIVLTSVGITLLIMVFFVVNKEYLNNYAIQYYSSFPEEYGISYQANDISLIFISIEFSIVFVLSLIINNLNSIKAKHILKIIFYVIFVIAIAHSVRLSNPVVFFLYLGLLIAYLVFDIIEIVKNKKNKKQVLLDAQTI